MSFRIVLVSLFLAGAVAAPSLGDIVINAPEDLFMNGIGQFAAAAGEQRALQSGNSNRLANLLVWSPGQSADTTTLLSSAPQTVGDLVTTFATTEPITSLVFGLSVNESGPAGSGDFVKFTQLDVTFGDTTFALAPDSIIVEDYLRGGRSVEAFLQLSLPYDLQTRPQDDVFSIIATLTSRNGPGETLFLARQVTVVPEPSPTAYFGFVMAIIAVRRRRRRSTTC